MTLRVALYCPDRAVTYDGRTPDAGGVGGGITARLSLLAALAALGHSITAYVNCAEPVQHTGVQYLPLDGLERIDTDVLIAISTGGDLSFAPLEHVAIQAALRLLWVQGVPQPRGIDLVRPDYVCAASNFLRDVCVARWNVDPRQMFVCYNGLHQARFAAVAANPPARDPFAISYIGPPEKGLDASVAILQKLRARDTRYTLDVFGGGRLWGRHDEPDMLPEGATFRGMLPQPELARELFRYEYCLAPQAIEEGFGIAVQEARRAGQIVFASRVGAFAELFRSSRDGFLIAEPHQSPEAHDVIAARIGTLAHDPARRARLRARAQATPWDWTLAARSWTAFWDDALQRTRAPRATAGDDTLIELPDGRHSLQTGHYYPDVYPASPMLDRIDPTDRVLIGGYYGHGNLGDEAILHAMLEDLREARPRVSAVVASGNPEATRRAHDVDAVPERDVTALIDAARSADLIVAGGGGLFQDYWGVPSETFLSRGHWGLPFFNAFPALAEMFAKPFQLYAVGVGPLHTEEGRRQTRLAFERADAATVRDPGSLQLLREIGACTGRIEQAADPAFLIEPAPADQAETLLHSLGLRQRPPCLVAVALRQWDVGVDEHAWLEAVASALDRIIEHEHATIVCVPFQTADADRLTDDLAVAERLRTALRNPNAAVLCREPLEVHQVSAIFAASDLVLAMRAHAVILAASAGTPPVALAYDPKVSSIMEDLGLEAYAIDLLELSSESLSDRLAAACRHRHELREVVAAAASRMRTSARLSTQAALRLLQPRPFPVRPASAEWRAVLRDALADQIKRAETAQADVQRLSIEHDRRDARETEHLAHVDDLTMQLQRRADECQVASIELTAIRESRAWRGISAYRRLRAGLRRVPRGLMRRVRTAVGAAAALVRAIPVAAQHAGTLVGNRRRRLQEWVTAGLMNPYVFLFDRFKRARAARYGAHLAGVQAACEPGLVSIVLPAYNGAEMIAESIDSVLAQTYPHFELIIVDDGSSDETPRIGAEYARRDPRIRVMTQDNQTLPRALNRGFREARGEFLTWTSCDNRLKPAFCEQLVACLRRHPCWDMAYANLDLIGEDGEYLRGTGYYEGYQRPWRSEHICMPAAPLELNVWANNTIGGAFMYRRRVAALVGEYSPHRFIAEDYDYWMRINALGVLRHADLDDPVYEYRFHSRSLTARWEEFRMLENRDRLMVFEEFRRDFYLSPMLWVIDRDPAASRAAAAIARQVHRLQHLVYDGAYPLEALPRRWTPIVHLQVARAAEAAAPPAAAAPPQALKVFVATDTPLPARAAAGWDLCCVLGAPTDLPRLDGLARGWIAAADVASLVHAIDIRAKSQHLAAIEEEAERPPAPSCAASVVICTPRIGARTHAAVRSVLDQRCDRAVELILVHNAPVAPEQSSIPSTGRFPVREIVCPVRGLSAARNAAIAEARGEIVCFLDDDAVADPLWLERLCDAFETHADAGVIGGHIYLHMPDIRPAALRPGWERYWSHFVTGYAGYTQVQHWWEFPWGANWAARRTALLAAGGFRTRYGRVGRNFWGGEELVTASVIQKLGFAVAVVPDASVTHDVDPTRFTFAHARRTLRAAHQVSYTAQRDLFIANQTGFRRTLNDFFTSHYDESIPIEYRHWRNASHRKRAQMRLLLVQLRDLAQRLRKPAVTLDPC